MSYTNKIEYYELGPYYKTLIKTVLIHTLGPQNSEQESQELIRNMAYKP